MTEKGMRCVIIGNFYVFVLSCYLLLLLCRLFLEKIYRYHLYHITIREAHTKVLNKKKVPLI